MQTLDAGFLSNKVILILSPQSWGNMMLAKHHYAVALAKRGNQVYYLNPPDNHRWGWKRPAERIGITPSGHPNLFIIDQQLFFPYNLKFHLRPLYDLLVRKQIRDILHVIARPIDLLWSFDLGDLFPLRYFTGNVYKIFHPVDEPQDGRALLAGRGADILFSVTREIIQKYKHLNIPGHFIHHGLAEEFLNEDRLSAARTGPVKAGMSGNMLRPDLDRETLLRIVGENPEVEFHFYGSYAADQSNIGAADDPAAREFIENLKSNQRVVLHGVLSTRELARALNQMDILLICYDIKKDQSRGTNYHKVMEYLSTGKVTVSNNVSAFADKPELVLMTADREDNRGLPELFQRVLRDIRTHNAPEPVELRIRFARSNTYDRQLDRIEASIQHGNLAIENK